MAFILDKQLRLLSGPATITAEGINWWCRCFSSNSEVVCESLLLARPVWRSEYLAQPKEYKTETTNKSFLTRAMGWSWLQPVCSFPVSGDAQCHDSEQITVTSNGNHAGIVTELCMAITMLC